jgi:hypothetical protein
MQKPVTLLFGLILVLMGVAALAGNLLVPLFGLHVPFLGIFYFWPLIIVGVGLMFVLPPILFFRVRGLGALFIPGMPILTTGCILFFANFFRQWDVWSFLWPLEVLSVAMGFVLAAVFMRVIWLVIPAILIGANGLVLQFCALTGLWSWWAVLWTIEPLALGLSFLLIGARLRSQTFTVLGLAFSGFAVLAFGMMSMVLTTWWWLFTVTGPLAIIFIGVLLLASALIRRPGSTPPPAEPPAEPPAQDVLAQNGAAPAQ